MPTYGHKGAEGRDELIGRILALAVDKGPAKGPCPSDEQMAALLDGGLKGAEREDVLSHLCSCDACREALVTAVRLSGIEQPRSSSRTGWFTGPLVPYAAAAAVLLAVVSGTLVYKGYRSKAGPRSVGMQAKATGGSYRAEKRQLSDADSSVPSLPAEAGTGEKGSSQKMDTPADLALSDMPEPVQGEDAGRGTEGMELEREYADGRTVPRPGTAMQAAPGAGNPPPGPHEAIAFSETPVETGIPMAPERPADEETYADSLSAAGTADESYFAKTELKGDKQTGAALVPPSTNAIPPAPAAEAAEELTAVVARADRTRDTVTVKDRGVVKSINLERGEIGFLPDGSDEVVTIKAEKELLKGLKAGDKIMAQYEKGPVNVASRIKKLKAVSIGVGC